MNHSSLASSSPSSFAPLMVRAMDAVATALRIQRSFTASLGAKGAESHPAVVAAAARSRRACDDAVAVFGAEAFTASLMVRLDAIANDGT